MDEATFFRLIKANPINEALLERLPGLGLPDAWLVSGCLFQTVWNALTGRPSTHGIDDYDVFYFDADTSYEAEDAVIKRCAAALGGLGARIEVRNQARVHLWFPEKFGTPYPPLARACDAIDRFLATACMVGVQPLRTGHHTLYAPKQLADLASMTLRPNHTPNYSAAHFHRKAGKWLRRWPELTVLPEG